MKLPSVETIKRAVTRAVWSGVLSALAAFVVIPINLNEEYPITLAIAMLSGFLMGVQKFVSGYIKYD